LPPRRALIVCPEPPYPLHGGGAFRTAAVLQYLARNYTLDAVFFSEVTRPDPRQALPAGLVHDSLLIGLPVHPRNTTAKVLRNAVRYFKGVPPLVDRFTPGRAGAELTQWLAGRHYDLAVVEHFWCAPFLVNLRPHAARIVLDLHNIESEWHERMAETEPWLVAHAHRRFAAAARRMELQLLSGFDTIMVTSQRERAHPGLAGAQVYPNTIPAVTLPARPRRMQIVFSANLEYQPNISAVKWFGEEVWPQLQRRHPGIEWVLVGRQPEAVRGVLPSGRVRTTGEVTDALPEIASSLAAIVPIRSGSGTRIKILEAWAAGTPVVSTSIGAEGLPPEAIGIADSPLAFAAKVSSLVADEAERERWAAAGRAAFNQGFTWEAGWKVLAALGI
jgi:polysaccharide biosynthesis protein PslH